MRIPRIQRRERPSYHVVQVGNTPVHYQVVGEGDPLILVHGLSGSMRWWERNVQALAQHHRVYLIDLPGFGIMRRTRARFAIINVANWLTAWMQAVGISKADLVGHSMGGYICLWIAAHRPELVSRLVLVDPAVLSKIRTVLGYTLPLLRAIRYLTIDFFFVLAYDALRAGPFTLLLAAHDLLSHDAQEDINKIVAPTLLIWGENDTLVPPSVGHLLQKALPHAQLLILKRAGHVSMFDQPQEFNRAVEDFLQAAHS